MYLCYCDICQLPIKEDEFKYILAVNKVEVKEEFYEKRAMTMEDLLHHIKTTGKTVKSYEICSKCKAILDRFLGLRIEEIKKIKKEMEELGKEK